jgi:hypothetical protein
MEADGVSVRILEVGNGGEEKMGFWRSSRRSVCEDLGGREHNMVVSHPSSD